MMKTKWLLCFILLLLVIGSTWALGKASLSIYDALQIAEKLEMVDFIAVLKMDGLWVVKGVNMHNLVPCELHIDVCTGLVEYSMNITPKDIVIGENTYGYSGKIYPYSSDFYKTNLKYAGLQLYRNDSRYFQMKNAIFVHNVEGFLAYFLYKGPGVTK